MEAMFSEGQVVRSRTDQQGLVVGASYEVVSVHVRSTFVGGFTSYVVRGSDGCERSVVNGHLVLERVS